MKYLSDGLEDLNQYPAPQPLTIIEKIGEGFTFAILFIGWIYFVAAYYYLESMVPLEYDINGKIISYQKKEILLAFPGLQVFLYLLLTVLGKYPERFKYPIEENEINRNFLYVYGRKLVLFCKLITIILFSFLTFGMLSVVKHTLTSGQMYYCFVIILMYVPGFIYYFVKCKQLKNLNTLKKENQEQEVVLVKNKNKTGQ